MSDFIPESKYQEILNLIPIFCVDFLIKKRDKVLLIKRNQEPLKGVYWFPGGRLRLYEDMDDFAKRIQLSEIGIYFDNYKKLSCITSAMSLIKLFTAEAQENIKIYSLINEFFDILKSDNWIKKYIFWELKLLKVIGYDLELSKIAKKSVIDNQTSYYVESKVGKKMIPNFLIELSDMNTNNTSLLNGLKLLGDFMEKNILKPHDINYPKSRILFINSLK